VSRPRGARTRSPAHAIIITATLRPPGRRRPALQGSFKDTNKFIRQAVLTALGAPRRQRRSRPALRGAARPGRRDQQKAIDAVVRANHPDTIRHHLVGRCCATRTRVRGGRGRGAQRDRHAAAREVSCCSPSRTTTGGYAAARRNRPRQDRRPARDRAPRWSSCRDQDEDVRPRRDRDPQPDQRTSAPSAT